MKKIILIIGLLLGVTITTQAQILHPVKWSYAAKKINATEAVILLKAAIEDGWHIYSAYQKGDEEMKTKVTFNPSKAYVPVGAVAEPASKSKYEKALEMDVNYFEGQVIFQQKIKLKMAKATVSGKVGFMACDAHQCLPPDEVSFTVSIK